MRTPTLIRRVETDEARTARHWRLQAPAGARTLTQYECLQHLAEQVEGRLHHQTGAGPRALIVRYAPYRDGVWVAVPDRAAAGHCPLEDIALEISGVSGDELWVVVVAGQASQINPEQQRVPVPGLPAHQAMQHVYLPATVVFGFGC